MLLGHFWVIFVEKTKLALGFVTYCSAVRLAGAEEVGGVVCKPMLAGSVKLLLLIAGLLLFATVLALIEMRLELGVLKEDVVIVVWTMKHRSALCQVLFVSLTFWQMPLKSS